VERDAKAWPRYVDARKGRTTEGNATKGVAWGERILNNPTGLKNKKAGFIINL